MNDENTPERSRVEDLIDQNLRRAYAPIEEETVPDRFKELLEKLRAQDEDMSDEQ